MVSSAREQPADTGPAIECIGVHKTYRGGAREVAALRGADLVVERGAWVAIMGPSGSGKSTLLQMIGGLDSPDSGTVRVSGISIGDLSEARRAVLRRRRIGYVFQFFNLVSNLSVLDNVQMPLLLLGTPRKAAARRAAEVLDSLGIADLAAAGPAELSGGQQQRVAIARALANRPDVLLADEPTGNLDSKSSAEVIDVLTRQHAAGQTIVMVTHDRNVADRAQRIVHVHDGIVLADEHEDASHDDAPAAIGPRSRS